MARPEKPVSPGNGPLSAFALGLRDLRRRAGGISYRQLSERANFSQSALSEAAAGNRLPTWEVAKAYVEACGGDTQEWRKKWEDARNPWCARDWQELYVRRTKELDKRLALDPQHTTWRATKDSIIPEKPDPRNINTVPQLVDSMNRLHIWYGKPSLRKLAARNHSFAVSTLSDALRDRDRLPSFKLVTAFAQACGEPSDLVEQWRNAWRRVALALQAQQDAPPLT
jgi:transcriptional regulator with XRE-family HTH domain